MKTRIMMTMLIAMMTNAVIFGIGAVLVLAVPSFEDHAMALMPWVVGAAFVLGPIAAWFMAPWMLARRGQHQDGGTLPARGEMISVR